MVSYISIERDSSGPLTHPDCLLALSYPLAGEAGGGDREEGRARLVGDRLAYEGLTRTCIHSMRTRQCIRYHDETYCHNYVGG